jgi:Flp pilus assembly pilin Flp
MVELHTTVAPAVGDHEAGQALVEYALILALVSIVCVVSLGAIGTNVNAVLQTVADAISP